jgi:hypothetical protein
VTIVRSTHSKSNAAKIEKIYTQLTGRFPVHSGVQELSDQLRFPLLT